MCICSYTNINNFKGVSRIAVDKIIKVSCMRTILGVLLGMFLVCLNTAFGSVKTIIWHKMPLAIHLAIGRDNLIEFNGSIKAYLPSDLVGKHALSLINSNGCLYLVAHREFQDKLVKVLLTRQHKTRLVLLRLSASKNDKLQNKHWLVVLPKVDDLPSHVDGIHNKASDQSLGGLIRLVAQKLYAPKYLEKQAKWLQRVAMHTSRFVPLYKGDLVFAMPLIGYKTNQYYLTAVLLRNNINRSNLRLKYNMLRGHFIAASFFNMTDNPAVLSPKHTVNDSTVVILVSKAPLSSEMKFITQT